MQHISSESICPPNKPSSRISPAQKVPKINKHPGDNPRIYGISYTATSINKVKSW